MQGMMSFLPILVMFGIFYFLLIRPQVRKQKEQQAMLQKLGKGDKVITRGGLIGTITGVSENNALLVLEIQEKVRVQVPRSYVEGRWDPNAAAPAAKSAA
jgi:preprotein translocase subunit YajC